jgi:hypothetical protein
MILLAKIAYFEASKTEKGVKPSKVSKILRENA